ncbi:UBX domain-containing protein 4 isoform X5 [Myxocyprinus asiaticus]|uniref:UBX domain-containing protein 4 isoform X5 n=1 Tax=Myxocyprinus asiaticus TaxID=70543 RepID=UPI002223E692|nr:UBX domain-containing protein 4 isoform X5 [Myxocyprinus asiaticus]
MESEIRRRERPVRQTGVGSRVVPGGGGGGAIHQLPGAVHQPEAFGERGEMHTQQIEGAVMDTERLTQTPVLTSDPQDTPSTTVTSANSGSTASKESLSVPMEEDGASGYVTAGVNDESVSSGDTPQPEEPLDARVERLTKKLEERRERMRKAEEENELKKELERRQLGKEMLDYKRKQEEEKTKRLLEERNREKAEEKAARERVKQQIALDRADRAARYAQTHQEAKVAQLAAGHARAAEQEAKRESAQRERSAVARIQFRLPDGSSFTNQFPSETLLQEARRFAAQEVGNRYGHFSLATMFPRREFSTEDLEKTLLELELAPSASIVLLPQQSNRPSNSVVHSSSSGGLWAILDSLLYPLLVVWRFISGFIFSTPPPAAAAARSHNQHTAHAYNATAEAQRDAVRKRVLEKRPEDFKKDGKIYRLRTQEDSEDDNNTWNGNSTQQM